MLILDVKIQFVGEKLSALAGKTIVITGGSRGIGQAIALRFAAAKMNVAFLSKDSPQ